MTTFYNPSAELPEFKKPYKVKLPHTNAVSKLGQLERGKRMARFLI